MSPLPLATAATTVYQRDRPTTYEEHRDTLRKELTLAEVELSEARIEQFDIDRRPLVS
jgi:hypothetical protein